MKKEFRVTLPELYDAEGCPDKTNPSARQGHYVRADSPEEAVAELVREFYENNRHRDITHFDVQGWHPERTPAQRIVGVRVEVKAK